MPSENSRGEEVDVLYRNMPEVFEIQKLPPNWEDDWIFIDLESADSLEPAETESELLNANIAPISVANLPERFQEEGLGLPEAFWKTRFPGSLNTGWDSPIPPPDAFGFYLPFHYFYPTWWGIYLVFEGIEKLGCILFNNSQGELPLNECIIAARIFIFGHEQFHHEMESFATRLEATNRIPIYKAGFETFFRETDGKDECLEEALASAHGFRRVHEAFKRHPRLAVLERALLQYMKECPPGYRRAPDFVKLRNFEQTKRDLAEKSHSASLPGRKKVDCEIWRDFPHAIHPFRKRGSRVNYLVRRGSSIASRLGLDGRYLRYREVAERLHGAGCTEVRQSGSHIIWRPPTGRTFPVPMHPGDLSKGTLAKIAKQSGMGLSLTEFLHA